jgi:hypothetical protein
MCLMREFVAALLIPTRSTACERRQFGEFLGYGALRHLEIRTNVHQYWPPNPIGRDAVAGG